MCEKTGQQLMFTSWKPSFLVPVTPGCKAKVQRLTCTTGVMLSLTCRVLNDAEGDKSLQNELRSKAYDCRLAATDVKRRDLLLYSVTQRFIVSSASSLTPKFRNKCLGEYRQLSQSDRTQVYPVAVQSEHVWACRPVWLYILAMH